MPDIEVLFQYVKQTPSDVCEHVERMRQLGSTCQHITEFGVRGATSTVAWVAARPKKLVCYDLYHLREVDPVEAAARAAGVEFVFHEMDVLKATIEPTDLLFLDTLHVYEQLREELSRHAASVRKYLVLHDTETWGTTGELPGSRGIWLAVEEFLATHEEWTLLERYYNNNGLTVLVRS